MLKCLFSNYNTDLLQETLQDSAFGKFYFDLLYLKYYNFKEMKA